MSASSNGCPTQDIGRYKTTSGLRTRRRHGACAGTSRRLTVPWVSNNARMDSSEAPKLRFQRPVSRARTLCPAAAPTSGRCPPAADAPVRDPGKPARGFPEGGVTPGGGPPVFFLVPIIAIVGSGKVRKGGHL